MTKIRCQHSFALNEQEEIDFITACSKFSGMDILRLGIKEALKSCPKVPKQAINKAKSLVK